MHSVCDGLQLDVTSRVNTGMNGIGDRGFPVTGGGRRGRLTSSAHPLPEDFLVPRVSSPTYFGAVSATHSTRFSAASIIILWVSVSIPR